MFSLRTSIKNHIKNFCETSVKSAIEAATESSTEMTFENLSPEGQKAIEQCVANSFNPHVSVDDESHGYKEVISNVFGDQISEIHQKVRLPMIIASLLYSHDSWTEFQADYMTKYYQMMTDVSYNISKIYVQVYVEKLREKNASILKPEQEEEETTSIPKPPTNDWEN